ncbi:MAG: alanine racemase [Oscillospiraceae bacterium]|nr:alanine racemase [Oscillospiraceae bacterium]
MQDNTKRTWAEISLNNIRLNYETIRAGLPKETRFLGVVKADSYGHGALRTALMLQEAGADYLAVACLDEAVELRRGGVQLPILILGQTPARYTRDLIDWNITQATGCFADAYAYSEEALRLGGTLKIHIKVDSGMSRVGFLGTGDSFDQSVFDIIESCSLPGLQVEGIFTHFAVSDCEGESNEEYTRAQYKTFTDVIKAVEERGGIHFQIRHCANSGATLSYKEFALDMVRPGIILYGCEGGTKLDLQPCMRLMTRICAVKEYAPGTTVSYGRRFTAQRPTRMGVIPIGYADGLHRAMSNKVSFAVAGKKAPQCGSICMDMCMIDITDIPEADVGTEVEIFGRENSIYELADAAGTISYELLCAVSKRVPRVYKDF